MLSRVLADGHKGNVCCAGVCCLMIFSGLCALRSLFPSGVRCRQLQVSLRWLCCRWLPDDIQRCCLVICRLSAWEYNNVSVGEVPSWQPRAMVSRRWWCRFLMCVVGGRLCLFVVVYWGCCGWLRISEDSGSWRIYFTWESMNRKFWRTSEFVLFSYFFLLSWNSTSVYFRWIFYVFLI